MTRVRQLSPDEMTPAQRAVYDAILAGPRAAIGGPFMPWLQSPDLADRAQNLGAFVRFETSLPSRLSELAILVTARHWTAQYEWWAHEPIALKAGLNAGIVAAIKSRQRPRFAAEDEELVYDFASTLHAEHRVDDDLYARAQTMLGEPAVVELVGILGYYTLVAMTLNVYEMPLPEGESPPLPD